MTAPHLPPLRSEPDPAHEVALLRERRRQLVEELAWLEAVLDDWAWLERLAAHDSDPPRLEPPEISA